MANFKVFMQRGTASVTSATVVTLPSNHESNQNKEVPELLFHDGALGGEGYAEKARFILATSDNSQAAIGYMVVV